MRLKQVKFIVEIAEIALVTKQSKKRARPGARKPFSNTIDYFLLLFRTLLENSS